MAVNKVNFGGNTLIDLTGDTLESAEQLMKGIIAHAKDGSVITGLMEAGGGGGGADISPWIDLVTFSITPSEDLTGSVDFTSFIPGRKMIPSIFILGNRETTSDSSYVQSMARISTWNSWQRLYYTRTSSTSSYPTLVITGGRFGVNIGSYKLEAGVPYWGVMLWK